MGLFQPNLGVPGGYGEWLVGDEPQYRLADYSKGKPVELDEWETDILQRITDPLLDTILRIEYCDHTRKDVLAIYVREDQIRNRWGDRIDQFSVLGM